MPVTLTESPTAHPDFQDFDLGPWLNLCSSPEQWVEGRDYDIYSTFANDDNVAAPTRFIIIHDPQTNEDLAANEYINVLLHNQPAKHPWRGNLLAFKTTTGVEIVDVEKGDIPLIKRLVTL